MPDGDGFTGGAGLAGYRVEVLDPDCLVVLRPSTDPSVLACTAPRQSPGIVAGCSGYPTAMEQAQAPLLDALADYHRSGRYGFSPPGHRQGRGVDERALAVLGKDPFRDDVLASGGLDAAGSCHKLRI